MRVPLFSSTSTKRKLYRRRQGGKGGHARDGSSDVISIGSGSTTGGYTIARSSSQGGGPVTIIPSGQMFSGRSQGGGTRNDIFGSRTYGSGYPGTPSRGVSGLGFPYYFWPLAWGSAAGGGAAYLHDTEYGEPNNSSRPGGGLTTVTFFSALPGNTTLHVIADNATTTFLLSSIAPNCSSVLASDFTGNQSVLAFDPTNSSMPKSEQAVQYYRASSIVLTLDGYNNTLALNDTISANVTDTPLPSWANFTMLDCVNQTIGQTAPLVDVVDTSTPPSEFSGSARVGAHQTGVLTLVLLLVFFAKALL